MRTVRRFEMQLIPVQLEAQEKTLSSFFFLKEGQQNVEI